MAATTRALTAALPGSRRWPGWVMKEASSSRNAAVYFREVLIPDPQRNRTLQRFAPGAR
jgi:hypothetical protein